MSELAKFFADLNSKPTISDAERAGYDCGKNGANTTNCHFRLFATPELTKSWERGKAKADRELK